VTTGRLRSQLHENLTKLYIEGVSIQAYLF
jgi:hypothetical protein